MHQCLNHRCILRREVIRIRWQSLALRTGPTASSYLNGVRLLRGRLCRMFTRLLPFRLLIRT